MSDSFWSFKAEASKRPTNGRQFSIAALHPWAGADEGRIADCKNQYFERSLVIWKAAAGLDNLA
jgi:hypothetical protein